LRTLCGNDRHVTPFRWKLVPSTIVYEETVAERTIARGTTLVKPLPRAAAHLAPLLRERARTRRRPRRRARARRRDPTALVRRSRPPRGDTRRATDERARRADPVQQERLHPRRRPDGGSRPRPARPPEERPPLRRTPHTTMVDAPRARRRRARAARALLRHRAAVTSELLQDASPATEPVALRRRISRESLCESFLVAPGQDAVET